MTRGPVLTHASPGGHWDGGAVCRRASVHLRARSSDSISRRALTRDRRIESVGAEYLCVAAHSLCACDCACLLQLLLPMSVSSLRLHGRMRACVRC
eukprot:5590183-Pleurochrysis_carterae.AAC.2